MILFVIGQHFVLDLIFKLLKFSRGQFVIVLNMSRHLQGVSLELKVLFVHGLDFVIHPELVFVKILQNSIILFFLFCNHFFVFGSLSFEGENLLIEICDLLFGMEH